jgi:hypothetical protein
LTRSSAFARWSISLVVSVISRSKSLISASRLSSLRRGHGQLQRGEGLAAGCAEQVAVIGQDALAGQQRVHAVLDRGAQVHKRRAVAEQIAQVAQLRRGGVRLGQQSGAQQVRERARVDRVGLHSGGGDRAGPEWVREVHVKAGVLEQLGGPFPAVGRLQRDMRVLRIAEQLADRLAPCRDPFGQRQLAVLVDDRDLRAPAVQVDADPPRRVTHGRSSSRIVRPRGRNPRGLQPCGSGRRADLLPPGSSPAPGPRLPRPFMTSTSWG